MQNLFVPAGALLLVLALTALLAQNMTATVIGKHVVERAVVERTTELRAVNRSLTAEVEQRRQTEVALRSARDKAQSANRAKSAFMATMSHELRTPLNVIIGFSGLMATARQPLPQQADYSAEIFSNGQHLLDLINDILDLTEMETGARPTCEDLLYLHDIIPTLVERAQNAADAGGVALKIHFPGELPALTGEGKRISKAIAHLIDNAIKFTPRGGTVVVSARQCKGALTIDIVDTGPGIPLAARQNIRERFLQQDQRLGRNHDGAGIGLAYVSRVADLHGAVFDIISTQGKGTCARLVFGSDQQARKLDVA